MSMTNEELMALVEREARQAGITQDELIRRLNETMRTLGKADLSGVLVSQIKEAIARSKQIRANSDDIRKRIKNGTRRTTGTIRLPV